MWLENSTKHTIILQLKFMKIHLISIIYLKKKNKKTNLRIQKQEVRKSFYLVKIWLMPFWFEKYFSCVVCFALFEYNWFLSRIFSFFKKDCFKVVLKWGFNLLHKYFSNWTLTFCPHLWLLIFNVECELNIKLGPFMQIWLQKKEAIFK